VSNDLWVWLGGITSLFLVLIVLQNYKGVAGILGGLGSLYGVAAVNSAKPTPGNTGPTP
jgi:O-antigen ligase